MPQDVHADRGHGPHGGFDMAPANFSAPLSWEPVIALPALDLATAHVVRRCATTTRTE